ncbi:anti-phage dCTP deaminase [Sorangium sp. So ce1014]|uniref:anti-phage dCTP deaminase n=1 Tax=Sorangium sp. So ce1014 TaxID=3133326 RepID=UPI003F5EB112
MVDTRTQEQLPLLVFGLAGRIGAGVSFVRDKIHQGLQTYGYQVEIIDVTRVFLIELFQTGSTSGADPNVSFEAQFSSAGERIAELQRRGNFLRSKYGDDIISRLCISHVINPWLTKSDTSKRTAFIIDSLKRPEEVDLLRTVFHDAFVMVAVVSSDERRKERLRERKSLGAARFDTLSDIDADEHKEHGQKAAEAILKADYFLANNFSTATDLDQEAGRLLQLVFDVGIVSPSTDEFGMHVAFEAAARSACLSRQVGAAIFSSRGTVLATGCNDVPKFGGGLYTSETLEDKRCWTLGAKCYNDDEKSLIVEQLLSVLNEIPAIKANADIKQEIKKALGKTRINGLIEFSRAVHAEMDAILAVARAGETGLVGATIYTTTYPCHNCAKHIIATGIKRLVFLEPYEKSLARKLHNDAIKDPGKSSDGVEFDSYSGVAPRRYNYFFAMKRPRKEHGRYIDRDRMRNTLLHVGIQRHDELSERVRKIAAMTVGIVAQEMTS